MNRYDELSQAHKDAIDSLIGRLASHQTNNAYYGDIINKASQEIEIKWRERLMLRQRERMRNYRNAKKSEDPTNP
jgi:RNA polymerase-binding transcription factor DksA